MTGELICNRTWASQLMGPTSPDFVLRAGRYNHIALIGGVPFAYGEHCWPKDLWEWFLKGIFRCKFNPWSHTLTPSTTPPPRDKVCRPLAYVVLASSETTAQQQYTAVNLHRNISLRSDCCCYEVFPFDVLCTCSDGCCCACCVLRMFDCEVSLDVEFVEYTMTEYEKVGDDVRQLFVCKQWIKLGLLRNYHRTCVEVTNLSWKTSFYLSLSQYVWHVKTLIFSS